MPVITLEAAHLTREQKRQLVREFTESASRIMEMPASLFYVFLKESDLDNIGVGGTILSDSKKNKRKKKKESFGSLFLRAQGSAFPLRGCDTIKNGQKTDEILT